MVSGSMAVHCERVMHRHIGNLGSLEMFCVTPGDIARFADSQERYQCIAILSRGRWGNIPFAALSCSCWQRVGVAIRSNPHFRQKEMPQGCREADGVNVARPMHCSCTGANNKPPPTGDEEIMKDSSSRPSRRAPQESGPEESDKAKLRTTPGKEDDGGESILSGRSREDPPQAAEEAELPPPSAEENDNR